MSTEINYDLCDTITGIKKDSIVDETIKNIVEKLVPDEIEYKGHYYVLAESRKTEDGYYKTSHNLVDIVSKLKYNLGFKIGRASAIDEVKTLIQIRLIDNLCLTDATKYGNKNAEQQANSYATVMKYEIASCIDDLFDDFDQLKEKKE